MKQIDILNETLLDFHNKKSIASIGYAFYDSYDDAGRHMDEDLGFSVWLNINMDKEKLFKSDPDYFKTTKTVDHGNYIEMYTIDFKLTPDKFPTYNMIFPDGKSIEIFIWTADEDFFIIAREQLKSIVSKLMSDNAGFDLVVIEITVFLSNMFTIIEF